MSMIVKSGFRYANSVPDAFLIPAVDSDGRSSNVQTELNKLYGAIEVKNFDVAANHNGIYRGITLVDTVNNTGRYSLPDVYAMVTQGDFSDIYIGDIIKVNQAAVTYTPAGGSAVTDPAQVVEWVVMGIDTYLRCGDTAIGNQHLVLVPKNGFSTAAHMNSTNTTIGGYAGSDMFINILPAYVTAVSNSLGSHVLTYNTLLSNNINQTSISSAYSGWTGCASSWSWYETTLNLLSEVEVFGAKIFGNLYDIGERNIQLPGFMLNPKLKIKSYGTNISRNNWWVNSIASTTNFTHCGGFGNLTSAGASSRYYIVPKVLFG